MRIVFLHGHKTFTGSAFKYPTLIGQHHELLVAGGYQDLAKMKAGGIDCPDLLLVRADRYTEWMLAYLLDVPYVLIAHDMASWRGTLPEAEANTEKAMFENAAGVLFTAETMKEYAESVYDIGNAIHVPLKAPAQCLDFVPPEKYRGRHICFAGGAALRKYADGPWSYRVLHDIFASLMEDGWTVHLHLSRPNSDVAAEYAHLGCVVHDPLPYQECLYEMARCQAGLLAYGPASYRDTGRPNKMYDYLAAGIPTLLLEGYVNDAMVETCVGGGWGVVTDLSAPIELPTITDEMRRAQTIDAHWPDIERLLQEAVG